MIILPYLISFIMGALTINLVLEKKTTDSLKTLNVPLYCSLALTIGLGISAALTFFSFITLQYYHRVIIISLNILYLTAILSINTWRLSHPSTLTKTTQQTLSDIKQKLNKQTDLKSFFSPLATIIFIVLATLIISGTTFLAWQHPHGEWDAWAMWNMKMKFFIFSTDPWSDIFTRLHWHTHRDYPLLLPLTNVWCYAVVNNHLLRIPLTTAVVLTTTSGLLLFGALKHFTPTGIALGGALLLMMQPFYIFTATSQYAEILIAVYLLSSISTLLLAWHFRNPQVLILSALPMGLMSFTKNEGLVMTGLLIILSISYMIKTKMHNANIRSLIYGLLIASLPTIIFKLFLAPANDDILPNLSTTGFTNITFDHIKLFITAIGKELIHEKWSYSWILMVICVVTGLRKIFKNEKGMLSLFFGSYFVIVTLIYITTSSTDLKWWLDSSLPRVFFQLFPTLLFYSFYLHFSKDTINTND